MRSLTVRFLLLALLSWTGHALAGANVLFILDASGSMRGKLAGQVKMDAAKAAFRSLLAALPKEARVGLEVYGHRGDRDCSVIELVNPVAPLDAEAITANVERLSPLRGATPIAAALERGARALQGLEGPKAIVLISDGKETCGGDPVAVARRLRVQGLQVVIHVVGLGVSEAERAQLAAIAAAGGGRYYAADSAEQLQASLAEIRRRVITTRALFRDDFDGDALGEAWEVVGADPEGMIVEEGMLQIVTQVPEKKLFDARNLVLYRGELPREYEVEARVLMTQVEGDCTKWHEAPFVGLLLRRDGDNAIALVAAHSAYECVSRKDAVVFARVKGGRWQPWFWADIGPQRADRPVRLRIRRMQRKFIGYYSTDGGRTWKELGSFAVLRPSFRLGLIAARGGGGTRPMLQKVDWFELRSLSR